MRRCLDCDADLSGSHGNTKRCDPCRVKKYCPAVIRGLWAEAYKVKRREKYANDPEFREKLRAYTRTEEHKRRKNAGRRKKYSEDAEYRKRFAAFRKTPEYKAKLNAHLKKRRDTDPEYRERMNAYNRSEEKKAWKRARWANDDEYREKRLREKQARIPWKLTPQQISERLEAQDGKCGICTELIKGDFHLDHILPLSRGGASIIENMQVTHPRCNLRRNANLVYYESSGQGIMALGYTESR